MRFIASRRNTRRMTARVGGSRNRIPKMSDRKPGVSSSAPPKIREHAIGDLGPAPAPTAARR